jgi:SOS-response transcriptional repressor LexA
VESGKGVTGGLKRARPKHPHDRSEVHMVVKYTQRQGQFLAFIYYYTKIHGCSPSELDMRQYFRISAPAIHQMVVKLEESGFIERQPRKPRSIRLLLSREELPDLE